MQGNKKYICLLNFKKNYSVHELCVFKGEKVTWYIANRLADILKLKDTFPNAKIVAGNTEIGIDVKFKNYFYEKYIQINNVPELAEINIKDDKVVVGGSVTLSALKEFCSQQTQRQGDVFHAIGEMLHWFGGQQVRNVATVSGNIITASPISDLNPILMAAGCSVTFASKNSQREVMLNEEFFTGYRKTAIMDNEILLFITIPLTKDKEYISAFKQSRRREDDIAIVNAGMRIKLNISSHKVEEAIIAFGGMAPKTVICKRASEYLTTKEWDEKLVQKITDILLEDLKLPEDAPGGMVAYRMALTSSFFLKFYLTTSNWKSKVLRNSDQIEQLSSIENPSYKKIKSSQMFEIVTLDQSVNDIIGRPIVHTSGLKHATGEAIYTDDTPPQDGELYGSFILSEIAHGIILSIDCTEALCVPGVVHFFDWTCLDKKRNRFGPLVTDEEIFASQKVTCQGQIIGFLVANSQFIAEKAAKLVKVRYEILQPIVTIEEAIKEESYFGGVRSISCGNADEVLKNCENILEGEMRIGGQQHFYLETQSCISTPGEDGEIDILLSTQGPSYVQMSVARVLGIPANRVRVRCRRMGGAFGGKETRSVIPALVTAIAAQKLGVSVRCVMNRADDMNFIGGRHPFLCKFKVGFRNNGEIIAVQANLYCNGGNSADTSPIVFERSLFAIDSGYTIPHWEIHGRVCKTNLPSNTAFRGYGSPQGAIFIENIIDLVAETVEKDSYEIRCMHMKKEGDLTPFGFPMENCTLAKCWDECVRNSNYLQRKSQLEKFNSENTWKKRGMVLVPTKHYLGFHDGFPNQAGALVLIYTDGSVSLSHGGTEMGQGLITKMLQVASRALKIPVEKIYFSETSTDKIPNTTATCASMSSDLNGMAVLRACEVLIKRLEPFKSANPEGKWEEWVNAVYMSRVSLSATGFYEIDLQYEFGIDPQKKRPFDYITYGAACSEVEIDCLTGDHRVIRTDIVMDVGESLNPAVDIGQIEGAFMQGYGLFTLEEVLFTPEGKLLTKGPGMYKIPSINDIPREFHVSLLRGSSNPRAVYSSKGIGEPPLFLASSIFLAIKDAIKAYRAENKISCVFRLDSPATSERIFLACNPGSQSKKLSEVKKWSTVV